MIEPTGDADRAEYFHDLFWVMIYHTRVFQDRIHYLESLLNQSGTNYRLDLRCPDCGEELGESIDADEERILAHYDLHANEHAEAEADEDYDEDDQST